MSVDYTKEVVLQEIVSCAATAALNRGSTADARLDAIEEAAREGFDAGIEHCKIQLLEQLAVQLGVDGRVFLAS